MSEQAIFFPQAKLGKKHENMCETQEETNMINK